MACQREAHFCHETSEATPLRSTFKWRRSYQNTCDCLKWHVRVAVSRGNNPGDSIYPLMRPGRKRFRNVTMCGKMGTRHSQSDMKCSSFLLRSLLIGTPQPVNSSFHSTCAQTVTATKLHEVLCSIHLILRKMCSFEIVFNLESEVETLSMSF